jgi:hypothetical protein
MNDLIKDHTAFGYVLKVEYRAIKEPGQLIDFIIRYYPGDEARKSVNRIRSYRPRNRKPAQQELPLTIKAQNNLPPAPTPVETVPVIDSLVTRLVSKPPEGFGISKAKARELIEANRKGVEEQIAAYPYREQKKSSNPAGWLIKAIENNYVMPLAYLEEKAKTEELMRSGAKKAILEACCLCDSSGLRYLGANRGVKKCTHDPVIEAKYSSTDVGQ